MSDVQDTETSELTAGPQTRGEKRQAKYASLVFNIQADTEKANEIADELNNIAALAAVDVGSKVVVTLGRADTAREEVGVVVGVKEGDDGSKTYKVQYGEGFDADFAVVGAAKITPVVEQDAAE